MYGDEASHRGMRKDMNVRFGEVAKKKRVITLGIPQSWSRLPIGFCQWLHCPVKVANCGKGRGKVDAGWKPHALAGCDVHNESGVKQKDRQYSDQNMCNVIEKGRANMVSGAAGKGDRTWLRLGKGGSKEGFSFC